MQSSSPQQYVLSIPVGSWIQAYAAKHMTCSLCNSLWSDPVCLSPSNMMCCRSCATKKIEESNSQGEETFTLSDLPPDVVAAFGELKDLTTNAVFFQQQQQQNTSSHTAEAVDISNEEIAAKGAASAGPGQRVKLRVKRQQPPAKVHHDHTANQENFNPGMSPSGNKSMTKTPQGTPNKSGEEVLCALKSLEDEEQNARSKVQVEETVAIMELDHKYTRLKAKKKGSTKALKIEADEKYEHGEYAAALELYSKALAQNDGTTKIPVLYGNRSAAFYMSAMYKECVEDCLKVTAEDTNNVKMYQRAVKACVNMGDLSWGLQIHKMIPEKMMNEQLLAERARLDRGAELHQQALSAGTSKDAEEHWKMLIAEFSDTVPFRVALSNYYFSLEKFERSIEVLSRLIGPLARNAEVLRLTARSMYFAGFEYFERAKEALKEGPALSNQECQKLLRLIQEVDDGKQQGNQLFSQRQFAQSVVHYTKAIDLDNKNGRILRILYCNRAAANKELGKYREGIEDCTKAIELDPGFSKAYARRARCHQHLDDYYKAIDDFKNAIKYEPSDHELARELKAAEVALHTLTEKEKDHYFLLGVSKQSTEKEIKLKYRELSLKWHPDKCVNLSEEERLRAEKKFKAIGEAYSTLMDANKRREYDLKQDRERFASSRPGSFSYFESAGNGYFPRSHYANPQPPHRSAFGQQRQRTAAAGAEANFW